VAEQIDQVPEQESTEPAYVKVSFPGGAMQIELDSVLGPEQLVLAAWAIERVANSMQSAAEAARQELRDSLVLPNRQSRRHPEALS